MRSLNRSSAIRASGFRSAPLMLSLAASLIVTGCGGDRAQEQPTPTKAIAGAFVGDASVKPALVAVVASKPKSGASRRDVRVYICDGRGIAEWFRGLASGNRFRLRSEDRDAVAQVTLTPDAARGTITLPNDRSASFHAGRTSGIAGLYAVTVSPGGRLGGASTTGARVEGRFIGPAPGPAGKRARATFTPAKGPTRTLEFTVGGPGEFRLIASADGKVRGKQRDGPLRVGRRVLPPEG